MKKEQPNKLSTETEEAYHVPVLLKESIEGLQVNPEGVYVDGTFGGGGHSREILAQLGPKGKLIAFDQDADAANNVPDDDRVVFVQENFKHLKRMLRLHGIAEVDGILADLGVSSHQFDEQERGFSIRFDADLDMRMDRRQELTAFQIVQSYEEGALHKLFEQYGEVTNAKTLAKTIVAKRREQKLQTIDAFKNALYPIVKGNPNKYFAQVFQALRIEVNDELGALKELLIQAKEVLKMGGRIAVITFHSIEDRMVKNFFKEGTFEEEVYNPFVTGEKERVFKLINKKPIVASDKEMKDNSRSRSAKLRVAEKIK